MLPVPPEAAQVSRGRRDKPPAGAQASRETWNRPLTEAQAGSVDLGGLRVLVAMLGARRGYLVPRALERMGVLELLFTDLAAVSPDDAGAAGTSARWRSRLLGRRLISGVPRRKVRQFPLLAARTLMRRLVRSPDAGQWVTWKTNQAFARWVSAADWEKSTAVYGFNSACREILETAAGRGMLRIVDQISVPWSVEQEILAEERRVWRGWEAEPRRDFWRRLADREQKEWELAHAIICGSEFVAQSVVSAGGPVDKCSVVRYGICSPVAAPERPRHEGALRVLFVGTVELRKGIQYLLEAVRLVGRKALDVRVVGPVRVSRRAAAELARWVHLTGALPRVEVDRQYAWADVFVLPSLAEGSANVCFEALSAGLPVITTPNAGSVVRDGVEGFIVPARDARAIADRLVRLRDAPDECRRMGQNARARAGQFSEEAYCRELGRVLARIEM